MKLKLFLYTLMVLYIVGCSTDDNLSSNLEQVSKINFKVIGEDLDAVYLFSYDGTINSGISDNLTEELGVKPDYLTLRQLNDNLSFYTFSEGAFSLVQKDINSGDVSSFEDFYVNQPDKSIIWGINNLNTIILGYFTPGTARNLAIKDIELPNLDSHDLLIDFNIDMVFQPIQYNGKVYLTYRDGLGNYKLTFYDIASKTQGPIVNFSDIPISILIADSGDLAVVKNGFDATLERYDANSLSFINSTKLSFNSGFFPGPIGGAVISDDKLYYEKPFVQPARFAVGPAVFNLNSQENTILNLSAIVDQVEEELGASIVISTQRFSKWSNMFLLAYAVLSDEVKGGIMQIDTQGALVANITFPFQPSYILDD